MILVMMTLALIATVAFSFAVTQSTTTRISQNARSHASARSIAESAMTMTLAHIRTVENWRTYYAQGQWVADQAFAGGTYSVWVVDGEDLNGDGQVRVEDGEGDGDLHDDPVDPITIIAASTYNGVTHEVQTVIRPQPPKPRRKLLFVVDDDQNLPGADLARQAMFESWGYEVALISATASESALNTAAVDHDVAYITETVNSSDLGAKLLHTPIGVVCEEQALYDEFGIAASGGGSDTSSIYVDDNSHYITEPFSRSDLTIATGALPLIRPTGSLGPGVQVLATIGQGGSPTLLTADAGDMLTNGPAAGRRVWLPWGVKDVDFTKLNASAKIILKRSIEWAGQLDEPTDPVGHWQLDGSAGGLVVDASGNGNHGSLIRDAAWRPDQGAVLGAVLFDGDRDCIAVPSNAQLKISDAISIAAWVYAEEWTNDAAILQKGADNGYTLAIKNGDICFRLRNVGEVEAPAPATKRWVHIAATWDGSVMRLYYNGRLAAAGNAGGSIRRSNNALYIGKGRSSYLRGMVDDVWLFDKELTASQVLWLFRLGDPDRLTPQPEAIAVYDFRERVNQPLLLHRWTLDDPPQPETDMLGFAVKDICDWGGMEGLIDAYRSLKDEYKREEALARAVVTSNAQNPYSLVLFNRGVLKGNAFAGPDADPDQAIQVLSDSILTGRRGLLKKLLDIKNPPLPSGEPFSKPADSGIALNFGDYQVKQDMHVQTLALRGFSKLKVDGDVTMLVEGAVEVGPFAEIEVSGGSRLNLYVRGHVTLQGKVNTSTKNPSRVRIYVIDSGSDIMVNGNADVHALMRAPGGGLSAWGDVHIHGGFMGEYASGDAKFHIDLDSTSTGMPPMVVDGEGGLDGYCYEGVKLDEAGNLGRAAYFDGSDDYILIPHSDSMLLDEGAFTFWFNSQSLTGNRGLLSKDSADKDTGGHLTVYTDGRRLVARMQTTAKDIELRSSANALDDDDWHHVAVVFGPEGFKLFLDGQLVDSDLTHTQGMGISSGGAGNYEPLVLGASSWGSGNLTHEPVSNHFKGYIDDVRVYRFAPSDKQVEEISDDDGDDPLPPKSNAASIVYDSSGHDYALNLLIEDNSKVTWTDDGLRIEAPTRLQSSWYARKIYDALAETDEMTLELIVTPAVNASANASLHGAVASLGSSVSQHNFLCGQTGQQFLHRLRTTDTNNNGSPDAITKVDAVDNKRQHLVMAYDRTEIRLYRNGELETTIPRAGALDSWDRDYLLTIANEVTGNAAWLGTYRRLAVYNRAMNAGQVSNLFLGLPPGSGDMGVPDMSVAVWVER